MPRLRLCKVKVLSNVYNKNKDNEKNTDQDILDITGGVENIKLDIVPISKESKSFSQHYVSIVFAVALPLYDNMNDIDKTYFIRTSILSINNRILPTFKIEYEPGFRFKKFVREKAISDFNFKNKDIISIKNINTNDNYHNYLVLLTSSKRIKSYKDSSTVCKTTDYTWHTSLEMFSPLKNDSTLSEIYLILSMNNKFIKYLSDDSLFNKINTCSIYNSISNII